jgi:apolipoprotein D and lipocalin family protein
VGCAAPAPQTVDHVDLDRYAGHWYEVARIPHPLDYFHVADTVEYIPAGSGKLRAVERYHYEVTYGPLFQYVGTLEANSKRDGKLKRQFGMNGSDYWLLALDPDYQYAMVGTPDRQWLRILSRTPALPLDVDRQLFHLADEQGYNIGDIRRTPQLLRGG